MSLYHIISTNYADNRIVRLIPYRHLLASLRELKVQKLVVTRDTEWGAL